MNQSRRQSLGLIAACAIIPLMAAGLPRRALAQNGTFIPPTGPMRLSRTLVRDLPDGAKIIVRRDWAVAFTAMTDGFSLGGQQTSVEVQTPPALEFLAEMEKKRLETGLLPILLTNAGTIAIGEPTSPSDDFDRAVKAVARQIDLSQLAPDDARNARQTLSALHKSAAQLTSMVPHDLFRPAQTHWQMERTVDLPNGMSGSVAVTFSARMDATGQLMERCERRIVSSIGPSSRTSTDAWELAPA